MSIVVIVRRVIDKFQSTIKSIQSWEVTRRE